MTYNQKNMKTVVLIIFSVCLAFAVIPHFDIIVIVGLGVLLAYNIYLFFYFRSEIFLSLKRELEKYVADCNDLNDHIADLKSSYVGVHAQNHGTSELVDSSVYNFKRNEWGKSASSRFVHNCSSSVVKNAHNHPFKYLCKYFGIQINEAALERLEEVFNRFSAAEQGKFILDKKRQEILASVQSRIPFVIRKISMERVQEELGFKPVDLSDLYFPVYSFQYVSAGGKSSFSCDVKLDLSNLEDFIEYLANLVKFRKSVAGQRALMTAKLREFIKQRDRYTCQKCDLSIEDEPNLLLEIDHVTPLARGGLTQEANLQTLCWRCNRSKGAKVE